MQMGLLEAKMENSHRRLEADLNAQMEQQVRPQTRELSIIPRIIKAHGCDFRPEYEHIMILELCEHIEN